MRSEREPLLCNHSSRTAHTSVKMCDTSTRAMNTHRIWAYDPLQTRGWAPRRGAQFPSPLQASDYVTKLFFQCDNLPHYSRASGITTDIADDGDLVQVETHFLFCRGAFGEHAMSVSCNVQGRRLFETAQIKIRSGSSAQPCKGFRI